MRAEDREERRIESEGDIVDVRRTVRAVATEMGFGLTDVTRIVTAASELARNILVHTGSGLMRIRPVTASKKVGIELTFEDHGPGISDVDQAMKYGYSSSRGLGVGLPGTKRLMDELEIHSEVGKGTTATVRKWLKESQGV